MDAPSPYGPDHSLLHAVLVLLSGLGVVATGVYVATIVGNPLSDRSRIQVAEVPGQVSLRSPASRRPPPERGGLAPGGGSTPIGGGVPAWAGSGGPTVPSESFVPAPQGSYDINPDFGHAELGAPSAPSGGGAGGGSAIAGESGPTGAASATSSAAPDLGGRSFGGAATGGDAAQWRSEARALASRSRALSGALGRIDRQGSRESARSRSETAEGDPSGGSTTASGPGARSSSAPGTPDDPDQVPLGGAEWLAAAGAAYALNRLRRREATDESDDGSSGTS